MNEINIYEYHHLPPSHPSKGLKKTIKKINKGFKRNRRLRSFGYSESCEYFKVYVWEWRNVLRPIFDILETNV